MSRIDELQKIDNIIGKNLTRVRIENGFTQKEIGSEFGFSGVQLSYYEAGSRSISACLLKKLADFYKVPVSVFYEGCSKVDVLCNSPRLLQINKKLAKIENSQDLAFIKSACDFALKKN